MSDTLSDRERKVLAAVVQTYIETAGAAGSRTIAKRFALGVSAATIRNTMSDLEERGYLYHPHTSAGRIPTDRAYRLYVDRLMRPNPLSTREQDAIARELTGEPSGPIERILQKAAQVLGVLTQELGVAVSPSFDQARLERLELVPVVSDRLLLVLVLKGGVARTIFVELKSQLPAEAIHSVAVVLNERLNGLTMEQIRKTLRDRLRDSAPGAAGSELLNIFVEEAEQLFDVPPGSEIVFGSAQPLAGQPEFSSKEQMRALLALTESPESLREALGSRKELGVTVTIGAENPDPKLRSFTIVTSSYQRGSLSGVIGVMGPTRMPYRKVLALVEHTSRLVEELAD